MELMQRYRHKPLELLLTSRLQRSAPLNEKETLESELYKEQIISEIPPPQLCLSQAPFPSPRLSQITTSDGKTEIKYTKEISSFHPNNFTCGRRKMASFNPCPFPH